MSDWTDPASLRGVEREGAPALDLRVFGHLRAARDGEELRLGGPKERAVLATLLAAGAQAVSVDGLVDALWRDDPPRSATRTVHAYIARLRRTLEPDGVAPVLITEGRAYRLALAATQVDATRFADLARRGRAEVERGDVGAALAAFDAALGEWVGAPYAGFEDVEACAVAAAALEQHRRVVVEGRFDALLGLGEAAELVPPLEAAVAEAPLQEHLWSQLMLALYRSGRQADALQAFQRARAVLVDELGVEPGAELRELEARILAHDERLRRSVDTRGPRRSLPAALDPAGTALVGRAAEQARLAEAWDRAVDGHGGFVSVVGPAGAGKTRLAAAQAAAAHEAEAVIAYARSDGEHRTARTLLDQALRSAGGSLVTVHADVLPGEGLGIAVARLLTTWADEAPVLVVLDDLDQADGDVLEVVADLAGGLADAAVLVVGLFRTEDGDEVPRSGQQIALGGLDRDAVAAVCSLYSDAWTTDEIDGVIARTGGMPLAVHDEATVLAREVITREVRAAASQAELAEVRLSASQQSVADHVVGLQRIVEQRRHQFGRRSGDCPFKGLASFDVDDAAWFFGRERLVAEVIARLASRPVLAIVGASGSGKSSLVRAGVIPALAAGVLPGSETWPAVVGTPGSPPQRPDGGGRTVLVVDQLEELFAPEFGDDHRTAVVDGLVEAVDDGCLLLVVVRADQLAGLAELPGLHALLDGNDLLVGPIRDLELRDVVLRPAELAGLRVEDGLVDRIVADAQGSAAVLPLVQTALLETWNRRDGGRLTLDGYVEAGGVHGAVARLAERAYAGLSDGEQAAAQRILVRLADASPERSPDLRRRVSRAAVAPADDADAWRALDELVAHRLVTADAETVEVSHEALFREWPRLAAWLQDDLAGRQLHQRLGLAAAAWEADARDPAGLLRGSRLSTAEEWVADHPTHLNDLEQAYLDASSRDARRELDQARARTTRLRRLLVAAALLLVAAVLAGLLAVVQRDRADESADHARDAELVSDASRLSAQALVDPRLDRALLTAAAGSALVDSTDTRAGLLQAVQRAPFALAIARLPDDARPQSVELSPDGTLLAVVDNANRVDLLDAETLALVDRVEATTVGIETTFLPDGRLAVGVGEGDAGSVRVVDPTDLAAAPTTYEGAGRFAPVVSTDAAGDRLLAMSTGPVTTYTVWDTDSGRVLHQFETTDSAGTAVLTPDGRTIVATNPIELFVYDADDGHLVRNLPGPWMASVSPDGSTVATVSDQGPTAQDRRYATAVLYDLSTGDVVRRFEAAAQVTTIELEADALVLGTEAGTEVWDLDGTRRNRFVGQANTTKGVALAADGAHAYSVSLDGTVIRWDTTGRESLFRRRDASPDTTLGASVVSDALGPDGDVYYFAGTSVAVRDGRSGEITLSFDTGHALNVTTLDVAPDGRTFAVGNGDGTVLLYDDTGALEATWVSEAGRTVGGVDFSADGDTLVVGLVNDPLEGRDAGEDVIVLDGATLEERDRIEVPDIGVGGIQLVVHQPGTDHVLFGHCCSIPSGSTGRFPSFLSLYDLAEGREVWRVETRGQRSAAFSDDGERLAVGGFDGQIELRDATDGSRTVGPVAAHDGFALRVEIAPAGDLVLSSGTDGLVRLWTADRLRPAGTFEPGDGTGVGGEFAHFEDGGESVLLLDAGRVWSVPIDPAVLRAHVCEVTGRDLSEDEWALLLPNRSRQTVCD